MHKDEEIKQYIFEQSMGQSEIKKNWKIFWDKQNENTAYQNLGDTAEAILTGKF